MREIGMLRGVGNAGVGTAMKPKRLYAREQCYAVENHPFRAYVHFMTECVSHVVECNTRHFGQHAQLECSDIVAIFLGQNSIACSTIRAHEKKL
jgi:hypothetical protein